MFLAVSVDAALSTATRSPAALADLCLDAAQTAAARHKIPAEMMQAITLVETRRYVDGAAGPWPWTLNIDGKGYWYETRGEASILAAREIAVGQHSVDLGCFQLNYRWHGGNFNSIDEMLDPALAADYAARFLRDLFAETGDWMRAAGHYHSRTPVHAERYRNMIGRALTSFNEAHDEKIAASRPPVPVIAAILGPRTVLRSPAKHALTNPQDATPLVLAGATLDTAIAAAPGAVRLQIFASPARPLFVTAVIKP